MGSNKHLLTLVMLCMCMQTVKGMDTGKKGIDAIDSRNKITPESVLEAKKKIIAAKKAELQRAQTTFNVKNTHTQDNSVGKKPFIPQLILPLSTMTTSISAREGVEEPLLTARGTNALFYKLDSNVINNEDSEEVKIIKDLFKHNPEEIADLHPSPAFGGKADVFFKTRWKILYNAAKSGKIDVWVLKNNKQNTAVGYFFMTLLTSNTLMIHPLTLLEYKDITAKSFFETYLKKNYGENLAKLISCMHRLNGISHMYSLTHLGFKNYDEERVEDTTEPTLRDKISYILPEYMNEQYVIVQKELQS